MARHIIRVYYADVQVMLGELDFYGEPDNGKFSVRAEPLYPDGIPEKLPPYNPRQPLTALAGLSTEVEAVEVDLEDVWLDVDFPLEDLT